MNRLSWTFFTGVALAALPSFGEEQGFFRPLPPAVAPPPPTATGSARDPAVAAIVEAIDAQAIAREAAQRDLDRAEREHARAQAEAARQPPPVIASPLDGTAPITSPLDGTAPIVSPIGR